MKHTPRLATALTAIVVVAILSVIGFQQPAAATLELSWPCDGSIILPFGDTNLASPRFHRGIDIAAPEGTEVKSPISGTVRFAGFTPAGGGTVSIDAGGGWRITLLQLENVSVHVSDQVTAGEVLGRVAASGDASSSEPHIHFGLIDPNGTYLDPAAFLPPQASSSSRGSAGESAAVEVESAPVSPAGELEGAGTLVAATDGAGERTGDPRSSQCEVRSSTSPYRAPAVEDVRPVVAAARQNAGSVPRQSPSNRAEALSPGARPAKARFARPTSREDAAPVGVARNETAHAAGSSAAISVAVTLATKACASRGASVEPPQNSRLSSPWFDAHARENGRGRETRRSPQAPCASDRGWESALCGVGFCALLAAWSRRKGVTVPVLQRFVVATEPA